MNIRRIILAIALVAFVGADLFGAAPEIQVLLELDEPSVLPAIPTGVTIEVVNMGERDVVLPLRILLTAETSEGERFALRNLGQVQETTPVIPADERLVRAGESRVFRYDVPPTVELMPWLTDGRIASPGKYVISAVITDEITENGVFAPLESLVSNRVQLSVERPTGDDAIVWEWMKKRGGGQWDWKDWAERSWSLADFTTTHYPDSLYALHSVVWHPSRDLELKNELMEMQIDRHPESPYTNSLRLELANTYSQQVSRGQDLKVRQSKAARGRQLASEVARDAASPHLKNRANQILLQIPTPEELAQDDLSRH